MHEVTSSFVAMADESVERCTRCSAVLASPVTDDKSILYCAACAVDGRAPPLVSGCRNACDDESYDSVQVAQSIDGHNHSVLSVVDNGAHVHSQNTTQDALCNTPEFNGSNLDVDCSSDIRSSVVSPSQEADIASSDQLQGDSDCQRQQSSVERLRKQMEMLALDEDIVVHCDITTEDDDDGSHEVESEGNLMKSTTQSSNSDTVLLSRNVEDDGDGLVISSLHEDAEPRSQQQLDGGQSDVPYDENSVSQSYNNAFNSARGIYSFRRLPVFCSRNKFSLPCFVFAVIVLLPLVTTNLWIIGTIKLSYLSNKYNFYRAAWNADAV